jgi:hypothetical protein
VDGRTARSSLYAFTSCAYFRKKTQHFLGVTMMMMMMMMMKKKMEDGE